MELIMYLTLYQLMLVCQLIICACRLFGTSHRISINKLIKTANLFDAIKSVYIHMAFIDKLYNVRYIQYVSKHITLIPLMETLCTILSFRFSIHLMNCLSIKIQRYLLKNRSITGFPRISVFCDLNGVLLSCCMHCVNMKAAGDFVCVYTV